MVQGREMGPGWKVGRVRIQGEGNAVKGILMKSFPGSLQDRKFSSRGQAGAQDV